MTDNGERKEKASDCVVKSPPLKLVQTALYVCGGLVVNLHCWLRHCFVLCFRCDNFTISGGRGIAREFSQK